MDGEGEPTPPSGAFARPTAFGNGFGLTEALLGVVAGFLLSTIFVAGVAGASHQKADAETLAIDAASLVGLWCGLVGAAILGSRHNAQRGQAKFSLVHFKNDFGVAIKPWPDLALGIVIGVAAQFILVPLLELPLAPFVPHLFNRLGNPAKNLTGGVSGTAQLFWLGLLVCLGSPLVEELFFRGLLLRALIGRTSSLGPRLSPAVSILCCGVLFGLVHFEPLQLIGLIGFGVVLGILAAKTGRLGPGIVAHMSFNAVTFISLAALHS